MKRILCFYLSVALILMGCGPNFMVRRDENPVITKGTPEVTRDAPVITQDAPVVTRGTPVITRDAAVTTREKTKDAKVTFVFRAPSATYKKLGLSKGYTVFAAQERMKAEGGEWRGFINSEKVILRNYGVKNAVRSLYGPGYLEPGHIFFAKFVREDKDGNRLWQARFIGQCGNEIPEDDLLILETPVVYTEKITATERIATTERITTNVRTLQTERILVTDVKEYRDVDYKPALWAGLLGILVGLGLGYLFWHGAAEIAAAAGVPCPPGFPAPRPPVP